MSGSTLQRGIQSLIETRPVFDIAALRVLLLVVTGWLERRERDALAI